ncbi:LacI family DNA-binding transcriptional regulator [Actinoplanes sp. L3-i22]|uniref:LacI family DNA-binding transcriptional regulator n=1 Tax=Actinoplanes sp. L3-i22 TaxID=2836373 RepID=UPI001C841AE1|nr:LacI family DNA-binding transcriptional regulator [Actinoplanes sp. L3-i22]
MKHPHRIQEIATRAGLSPATVDRVLHERGGVRESTTHRVHRAIADLDHDHAPADDPPPRDFEAGATAAYLVEQWLHDRAGDVLVVGGPETAERIAGFRSVLGPARRLRTVTDPDQVRAMLAGTHTVRAVYAPRAGGSAEVVAAFEAEDRNYDVFVAHGLDRDNLALLHAHRINAVLHQDRRSDLRTSCRAHGAPSIATKIITPFNAPVS